MTFVASVAISPICLTRPLTAAALAWQCASVLTLQITPAMLATTCKVYEMQAHMMLVGTEFARGCCGGSLQGRVLIGGAD